MFAQKFFEAAYSKIGMCQPAVLICFRYALFVGECIAVGTDGKANIFIAGDSSDPIVAIHANARSDTCNTGESGGGGTGTGTGTGGGKKMLRSNIISDRNKPFPFYNVIKFE